MKHARSDYNRIQDPDRLIGEDEPVFLIRGQDKASPVTVRTWTVHAKMMGADERICQAAYAQADAMEAWQKERFSQIPDAPPETLEQVKEK